MLISRQFIDWAQDASATRRAAGATSLVCDFLHGDLSAADKASAESLLTGLLDDPSPLVRRALAEGFAREPAAPRHIMSALAADKPEIAAIVFGQGLHFSSGELAEAVLDGGADVHLAIARRPKLHALVVDVLAEQAESAALIAVAENHDADLREGAMLAMLARASDHAALREALLRRPHVPASVRARLADAVSAALSDFITHTGWLPQDRLLRVLREARESVVVMVAGEGRGARGAAAALARQLRTSGQLTPALLIRSLLGGDPLLYMAALAELAGTPFSRVAELVRAPDGPGFAALYAKAGLPPPPEPVFVAILRGIRDGKRPQQLANLAIAACAAIPEENRGRILTLLRKIESDAARDQARSGGV